MRDWVLRKDMNLDGLFTISDIFLFLKSLFFYPGDFIVSHIINTDFGIFFEFTENDYGGITSVVISISAWIFLGMIISILSDFFNKIGITLDTPIKINLFHKKKP